MSTNAFEQSSSSSKCGKGKPQTLVELRGAQNVKQCESCKFLGVIFLPEARTILHYHNKLDHMVFDKLKDLARAGYLPRKLLRQKK